MRKIAKSIILIGCIAGIVVMPGVGFAAEYYAAPDGDDDTGDGSFEHPWLTWKNLPCGSTLYMRGGRYILNAQFETVMGYDKSGTADQPTTICNYLKEQPIIDYANGNGLELLASYIVFRGLTMVHSSWACIQISRYPPEANKPPSQQVTIDNCVFEDNAYQGIKVVIPENRAIEIMNCTFRATEHGSSFPGGGIHINCRATDASIHDNTFYLGYMGILLKYAANSVEVYRNIFIGQPEDVWVDCMAISLGGAMDTWVEGVWAATNCVAHDNLIYNWPGTGICFWEANTCQAYNNTVVVAGDWPAFVLRDNARPGMYCRNVTIKNNIAAKVAPGSDSHLSGLLRIAGANTDEGFLSDHNLWYDYRGAGNWLVYTDRWGRFRDLTSFNAATGNEANGIYAEPLFVNPTNRDLHLQSSSPAIDAGTDTLYSPLDYDGNTRPYDNTVVDIGAYEYQGAQTSLPGDIDGDGDVDLQDLLIVAKGYGVTYDLQDLLLVAMHYGECI